MKLLQFVWWTFMQSSQTQGVQAGAFGLPPSTLEVFWQSLAFTLGYKCSSGGDSSRTSPPGTADLGGRQLQPLRQGRTVGSMPGVTRLLTGESCSSFPSWENPLQEPPCYQVLSVGSNCNVQYLQQWGESSCCHLQILHGRIISGCLAQTPLTFVTPLEYLWLLLLHVLTPCNQQSFPEYWPVSSPPQKGPSSGTDRVKKGGSYMCHKVTWYFHVSLPSESTWPWNDPLTRVSWQPGCLSRGFMGFMKSNTWCS